MNSPIAETSAEHEVLRLKHQKFRVGVFRNVLGRFQQSAVTQIDHLEDCVNLKFSGYILFVMTMLHKIWVISSIVNPQKKYSWKVQTLNFSKHQTKRSNSF